MPKLTPEQKAKKKHIEEKLKIRNLKAKTKKQFSRSKLIKEADTVFSKYIRFVRDKDKWCITCWNTDRDMDNWHFQSRRFINTRWSEMNCAKQCSMVCNNWHSWEQVLFWRKIDETYWDGTAEAIEILARKVSIITDDDILEIIQKYYKILQDNGIDHKYKKQFICPNTPNSTNT